MTSTAYHCSRLQNVYVHVQRGIGGCASEQYITGRGSAKAERAYNGPIPIEKWPAAAPPTTHPTHSHSKSYVAATRQSLSQRALLVDLLPVEGRAGLPARSPRSETLLLEQRDPPLDSHSSDNTDDSAKIARSAYSFLRKNSGS